MISLSNAESIDVIYKDLLLFKNMFIMLKELVRVKEMQMQGQWKKIFCLEMKINRCFQYSF